MNLVGYFPDKHNRWSSEMQLNVPQSPGCETRKDSYKSTQLQHLALCTLADNYRNRRTALHDDVTYVIFSKFCMYLVCLCLLITALNPAVVGYSLDRRTCSTNATIPLLVLNPIAIHCPAASGCCEEIFQVV